MRIKKFRLAEGLILAFMAAGTIVASTADWQSPDPLSHESVPFGYLAALVELVLAAWLTRGAIRGRV